MVVTKAEGSEQSRAFSEIRLRRRTVLKEGLFYAEGEQVVKRLLHSNVEVVSMFMTPEYFDQFKEILEVRLSKSATVLLADKISMEEKVLLKLNQGILALGKIPESIPPDEVIARDPLLLVALDGIDHAVNVGTILRSCAAFDATAVLVDDRSAHPYSFRAIKASIGGVFFVPVIRCSSLPEILMRFRRVADGRIIAADPAGTVAIESADFSGKLCLVLSNEHSGLSSQILSLVPLRVSIPLSRKMDSLNVAAAAAIFLHRIQNVKTAASKTD